MTRGREDARLAQLAALVGQTAAELDVERLSRSLRAEFLDEIDALLVTLAGESAELTQGLERLRDRIVTAPAPRRARAADDSRVGELSHQLKRIALLLAARASAWLARHARLSASS